MVIFHSYVKLPEGKSRFKLHFQFSCTTQSGRENRNAASSNVTWHKLETHWAGAADGCQDLSILTGTCPDRSATANFVTSSWCCLEQICGWHFSICVLCKIISRPFAHNIYLSIYLSIDCIYVYNQVYDLIIIILPKILQDHLNPLRSPCRSPWIPV